MNILNSLLENKIGFGNFQIRYLCILSLIDLNDGIEILLMSITLPIIKNEYNLNSQSIQWLQFIFNFGMFFGALISGYAADLYGRKIVGFVALSFFRIYNINIFILARLIYGIVYGISLPLSTSLYSEISPQKMRGKGVIIINFSIAIGQLIGLTLSYLILDDISTGNWRLLLMISSIPCFLVSYLIKQYIFESPRYQLLRKQYNELQYTINEMYRINGINLTLNSDELDNLKIEKQDENQLGVYTDLIESSIFNSSICLWILWSLVHCISIGQIQILPFILQKSQKAFKSMFSAILGELPSIYFSWQMIDNPKFGRKGSLIIFQLFCCFSHLLCFLNQFNEIALFFSRMFVRQSLSLLYVLTNEIYDTKIRAKGMAVSSGIARFSVSIFPFIIIPLVEYNKQIPFLLFTSFAIINIISAQNLQETSKKLLDEKLISQLNSLISIRLIKV